MKVKILLGRGCLKQLLDLADLVLRLLVTPRIRESEVGRFVDAVAEHVLELKSELIIVVEKVIDLLKDASPLLLCVRQHSEHWLETLAVQFCLVIEVLEDEGQLLTLRHSLHREVKPGAVSIILVRSSVV